MTRLWYVKIIALLWLYTVVVLYGIAPIISVWLGKEKIWGKVIRLW